MAKQSFLDTFSLAVMSVVFVGVSPCPAGFINIHGRFPLWSCCTWHGVKGKTSDTGVSLAGWVKGCGVRFCMTTFVMELGICECGTTSPGL